MENLNIDEYSISLWGSHYGDNLSRSEVLDTYLLPRQCHSNSVHKVEHGDGLGRSDISADAFVCDRTVGIPIATYVADCQPIVIVPKELYAVAHGSGKSLHDGILENTLGYFQGLNCKVYIGPSNRSETYEVGKEFYDFFEDIYLDQREGKIYLDLLRFSCDILSGYNTDIVSIHQSNTYTSNDRRSYRQGPGKMRNVIGVQPI